MPTGFLRKMPIKSQVKNSPEALCVKFSRAAREIHALYMGKLPFPCGGHHATSSRGVAPGGESARPHPPRWEISNAQIFHRSFRATGRQPSTAGETSAATTPSPLFPESRQTAPMVMGTAIRENIAGRGNHQIRRLKCLALGVMGLKFLPAGMQPTISHRGKTILICLGLLLLVVFTFLPVLQQRFYFPG